jgi:hypothetical protein
MRSTLAPFAEANTIETVRLADEGDIGASLVENQPVTNQGNCSMSEIIAGIRVPDSAIARAATQLVRDTEDDLLYNHSRRVFLWGALTGERRGLKYDPELLYLGAMFHDMGLTEKYSSPDLRFEVDGTNAARDFMKSYGVPERDVEDVWTAIALHTTPGIPEHMRPTIALGDRRCGDGCARHQLSRLHA